MIDLFLTGAVAWILAHASQGFSDFWFRWLMPLRLKYLLRLKPLNVYPLLDCQFCTRFWIAFFTTLLLGSILVPFTWTFVYFTIGFSLFTSKLQKND